MSYSKISEIALPIDSLAAAAEIFLSEPDDSPLKESLSNLKKHLGTLDDGIKKLNYQLVLNQMYRILVTTVKCLQKIKEQKQQKQSVKDLERYDALLRPVILDLKVSICGLVDSLREDEAATQVLFADKVSDTNRSVIDQLEQYFKRERITLTDLKQKLLDSLDVNAASIQDKEPIDILMRDANLQEPPTAMPIDPSIKHISVGDLHGNALKLIYTLIQEGFLRLETHSYLRLVEIYQAELLTQPLVDEFKQIILSAVCDNTRALTLIGDVLCDRGNNDYLTLLVLEKLKNSDIEVDILLSNHDMEFIKDYESDSFSGGSKLERGQSKSLSSMKQLIDKEIVTEDEIRRLVESAYVPKVKAISYTLSADKRELSIFTHAPVGLETIEKIAKTFRIEYREDTVEGLIQTIDEINKRIIELLHGKKLSSELQKEEDDIVEQKQAEEVFNNRKVSIEFPLTRLTWSGTSDWIRTTKALTREPLPYTIFFTHGHVGPTSTPIHPKYTNLDSLFGKNDFCSQTGHFREIKVEQLIRHSPQRTARQMHVASPSLDDLKEPIADENSQSIADFIRKRELLILSYQSYKNGDYIVEKKYQAAIDSMNQILFRFKNFMDKLEEILSKGYGDLIEFDPNDIVFYESLRSELQEQYSLVTKQMNPTTESIHIQQYMTYQALHSIRVGLAALSSQFMRTPELAPLTDVVSDPIVEDSVAKSDDLSLSTPSVTGAGSKTVKSITKEEFNHILNTYQTSYWVLNFIKQLCSFGWWKHESLTIQALRTLGNCDSITEKMVTDVLTNNGDSQHERRLKFWNDEKNEEIQANYGTDKVLLDLKNKLNSRS